MTDIAVSSPAPVRYRQTLLCGLLLATMLPAITIFINYQVDASIYAVVWLISAVFMISSAHSWLTLAYYTDREWLIHFRKKPVVFFVVPALILVTAGLWMALVPSELGFYLILGVTFLNLWHHAKQNWGIVAIVGRIRRQNVSALRIPLCWAWPFFVIPAAMQHPQIANHIGQPVMYGASVASAMLYLTFFGAFVSRSGFLKSEPLVLAFGLALGSYFLPMVFLFGKPYGFGFWGFAHGLQYLLMVLASLSFKKRRSLTTGRLAANLGAAGSILGLIGLLWYFVFLSTGGAEPWASIGGRIALGLAWAVPLVHFWIDAFIWKFSDKEIRQLHGDAFAL